MADRLRDSDIEVRLQDAISKHRQGDLESAEKEYRDILLANPGHAEARHMTAVVYLQRGQFKDAEIEVRKALKARSSQVKFHNTLGSILMELNQFEAAIEAFDEALSRDKNFSIAAYNKGTVLLKIGKLGPAERAFRLALEAGASDANVYNNLANSLVKQGRINDAIKWCCDGLVGNENDPLLSTTLASALEQSNDLEGAEEVILGVRQAHPDFVLARIILARILRRRNVLEEALACLEPVLQSKLSVQDEAEANFEMGLIQDLRKRFADAFQHFNACNLLLSKSSEADQCDGTRYINEIKAYRKLTQKPWQKTAAENEKNMPPVFFVGFPRSGTTLMEQMLKAHPNIVTTEEDSPLALVKTYAHKWLRKNGKSYPRDLDVLSKTELVEMRRLFWFKAEELVGSLEGRVLVDKLPLNIVSLALVEKLWPKAKVLVALRDPRDVCLSCFIQRFSLNNAMINFLDIEHTGLLYQETMGLWWQYREVLNLPWFEYKYEDLVDDFEGTLRNVLEFIGVTWDESVSEYREAAKQRIVLTPSYREVTSPIHNKAVQRWVGYREELSPILPMLEPFVQKFGYGE